MTAVKHSTAAMRRARERARAGGLVHLSTFVPADAVAYVDEVKERLGLPNRAAAVTHILREARDRQTQ